MPLYEYRCPTCEEEFSAFRSAEERQTAPCPVCGKKGKKLMSPVGIIFKGSGFHVNDYPASGARCSGGNGKESKSGEPDKCATCPSKPTEAKASA